jgi:hypothetical protein
MINVIMKRIMETILVNNKIVRKHSPESIEKMKASLKGRTPWNKGKKGLQVAWNKGKPRTWFSPTEFKLGHNAKSFNWTNRNPWNKGKTGLSIGFSKGKHNIKISGKNHYCWKGGISPRERMVRNSLEMKVVCADSKERDNYTCQMPGCGIRGGELNTHHIKSFREFPKLRFEISNLITLCVDCHNLTKGGKEKTYEELFINIIKLK